MGFQRSRQAEAQFYSPTPTPTTTTTKPNPNKQKTTTLITGLEKKQPDREDTGSLSKELTEQAQFDTKNIWILANVSMVPRKAELGTSLQAPSQKDKQRRGM